MTPVDKDDFEDAELARRLAAMPQPEPSQELDAAIFAQVQKDLAPGPAAANDPAKDAPRPTLLHRYRAPLAFAASLAGIAILLPVWRSMQQQEVQPAEVPIILNQVPDSALPLPKSESAVQADKKTDAPVITARPAPAAPQVDMAAAPEPAAEIAPVPTPPPAPAAAAAAAAAAAPAYAPPPVPAMEPDNTESAPKAAARSRQESATGIGAAYESPKDWLQTIERLLDAGDTAAAAAQWKRFRKANPEYPVPDTLADRLKALE